jgi:hypothetical protein
VDFRQTLAASAGQGFGLPSGSAVLVSMEKDLHLLDAVNGKRNG